MAVLLPKTIFNAELRRKISTDLWVEEKYAMEGSERRCVQCFEVDKRDPQWVRFPHSYAMKNFPTQFQTDAYRPELDPIIDTMSFTGSLLEEENRDQKTVAATAWKHLMERGCVLLNAYPGFGKTMLFTAISCRLKKKTLVLCTQDRLLEQAMDTYRTCSTARICKLSAIKQVDKEVWESVDVFFSTEKSCYKLGPYLDLIGTLIIDECHEFCSPTRIGAMLMTRPRYLICCSASLQWKKDGLEQAMWHFVGEECSVVRRIGKKFYVLRYNCINNISIKTKFGKLDYAAYMKDLHESPKLMEELMDMIRMNTAQHKILILVKNIEFVDRISQQITERGIYETPSVLRGTISKYIDSRILIGTFSKIGTGFDPKSKDWDGVHFDLLMLVDSTRTTGLLEQLYGRVFRSKLPIVVNWVFNNPIANGHFMAHRQWYVSYTNAVYLDLFKPVPILDTIQAFESQDDESDAAKQIIFKTRGNKRENGNEKIETSNVAKTGSAQD
jgi:superfamily II DNA or RNA helicase